MKILENRGNWYKGNLHMHTTVSDGVLEPVDAINDIGLYLRPHLGDRDRSKGAAGCVPRLSKNASLVVRAFFTDSFDANQDNAE